MLDVIVLALGLIFFVLSIGITRVRAELGPPAHELNWVNPEVLANWGILMPSACLEIDLDLLMASG